METFVEHSVVTHVENVARISVQTYIESYVKNNVKASMDTNMINFAENSF